MIRLEPAQAQPNELFAMLLQFSPLVLIFAIVVVVLSNKDKRYKKSAYYQITKNPYSSIKYEKGKQAEYLTYKSLRHFENSGGKFLFNLYVPKENNETTEVDVLLICPKGLFVFECKNFGGWIFGNEAQKKWTQTLPLGRGRSHKEYFYNPIMQNASHIRHLKNLVGKSIPMRSVIVFSDRSTLKNVTINSDDVSVINHDSIVSVVAQICNQTPTDIFTQTEIDNIYTKLYPFTQIDYQTKKLHIENLRKLF